MLGLVLVLGEPLLIGGLQHRFPGLLMERSSWWLKRFWRRPWGQTFRGNGQEVRYQSELQESVVNLRRARGRTCDQWHQGCFEHHQQQLLAVSSLVVPLASSSRPLTWPVARPFSARLTGRRGRASTVWMAIK